MTLVESMRSDQVLFDFYTSLSGERPIAEIVREARILFPITTREPDTILVISHARRRFLNCKRNLKEKPMDAVYIRAPQPVGGTGLQSMFVWPGLRVMGAGGAVKKGVFETIALVSEDGGITLENCVSLTAAML